MLEDLHRKYDLLMFLVAVLQLKECITQLSIQRVYLHLIYPLSMNLIIMQQEVAMSIRLKYSTVQMVPTWFDSDWSAVGGSNLFARTVNTTLTSADHGVGASTYYIAFVFDGDMGDINYWYIDDVQLATVNSFNNLVVDKSNADVIMEGGIAINNDLTIPSGHGANVILNPTARLTVNGSLNNDQWK